MYLLKWLDPKIIPFFRETNGLGPHAQQSLYVVYSRMGRCICTNIPTTPPPQELHSSRVIGWTIHLVKKPSSMWEGVAQTLCCQSAKQMIAASVSVIEGQLLNSKDCACIPKLPASQGLSCSWEALHPSTHSYPRQMPCLEQWQRCELVRSWSGWGCSFSIAELW